MKVVPMYDAKNRLSEYAADSQRVPVIITRHGRPYAALVGLEGQDLEAFLLSHHRSFLAELDRAIEAATKGGISLSEMEQEVAARERRRGRRPARRRAARG